MVVGSLSNKKADDASNVAHMHFDRAANWSLGLAFLAVALIVLSIPVGRTPTNAPNAWIAGLVFYAAIASWIVTTLISAGLAIRTLRTIRRSTYANQIRAKAIVGLIIGVGQFIIACGTGCAIFIDALSYE